MTLYLVCFDLTVSPQEQREQVFYWLQFLNSAEYNNSSSWRVIVVGLKSDMQTESVFSLDSLQSWKIQMPNLPLYQNQLFGVGALHSKGSVRT